MVVSIRKFRASELCLCLIKHHRECAVGIVIRLWSGSPRYRVSIPGRARRYLFSPKVQPVTATHPVPPPHSVGTGVPCPVVKLPGCEFDNFNPSKAKVRNAWSHISASIHTFMRRMGITTLELGYKVMKRFCLLINKCLHNPVI